LIALLQALAFAGALAWIAPDPSALAQYAAFLALLVLPAASLARAWLVPSALGPWLRAPVAVALVCIAMVPIFLARKALPAGQVVFDVALCAGLAAAALRARSLRPFLRDLAELAPARPWVLVAIPLVFATSFIGFEARLGDQVRYWGLFPVDFANLASFVSLARVSPMLPLAETQGGGALSYHWLYFAIPAYLADFLGGDMRSVTALVLSNTLAASLLFAVLCAACDHLLPRARALRVPARHAALVVFASSVMYFYHEGVRRYVGLWYDLESRNHKFLLLTNSLPSFGNNSLALVMCLLALLLIDTWNHTRDRRLLWIAALCCSALIGYSATLAPPLALTLIALALLRRVREPWTAVAYTAAVGVLPLAALVGLGLLSGSRFVPLLEFDGGRFVRNASITFLPLLLPALVSLRVAPLRGAAARWWIGAASCAALPSFLAIGNSITGAEDLCMKTGSLFAVLLAPPASAGWLELARHADRGGAHRWLAAAAAGALLVGLANSAAYVFQFPAYRIAAAYAPQVTFMKSWYHLDLHRDYFEALRYLRRATPRGAIVLDPVSLDAPLINTTLMLGERRVFVPDELALLHEVPPELAARAERFRSWRAQRFEDPALAREFAASVDYLVGEPGAAPPPPWQLERAFGAYAVYRSLLR
jgi:hypothetical protein